MHKLISSVAISVLALCPTWSAAQSVSVPFDPVSAVIQLDLGSLASNGTTLLQQGSATLAGSTLTLPVASIEVFDFGGAYVHFAADAGFILQNSQGSFTFKDFFYASFDRAIIGDFEGVGAFGALSLQDHGLLIDYGSRGYLGQDELIAVKPFSESRPLSLSVSSPILFDGLASYLSSNGINPASVPIQSVFQTLTVSAPAVPEPASMLLVCGGLSLLAMARRRSAKA